MDPNLEVKDGGTKVEPTSSEGIVQSIFVFLVEVIFALLRMVAAYEVTVLNL